MFVLVCAFTLALTFVIENPNRIIRAEGSKQEVSETAKTSKEILDDAVAELETPFAKSIYKDISLVSKLGDVAITWTSDHRDVVSEEGRVTRKEDGQDVKLTATLTYDGLTVDKEIQITVIGTNEKLYYKYDFNESLNETNKGLVGSHLVGNKVFELGGTENYTTGIVKDSDGKNGSAFKFDGNTGIKLPANIISSNVYSVSMWVKPETITHYTSLFFGEKSRDEWISLAPFNGDEVLADTVVLRADPAYDSGRTNIKLPLNKWSQLTITNDQGTMKVYHNGKEVASGVKFPDLFSDGKESSFSLGVNFWDPAFKGSVDDLIIYPDTSLSAEDIENYYEEINSAVTVEDTANDILESIFVPTETKGDLNLINEVLDTSINWSSSNEGVICIL